MRRDGLKKFRLHFNRINMQRGNPNVWTVHMSKACYQVKSVVSYVTMETRFDPKGRQPRAYLFGRAKILLKGSTAYLFY